MPVLGVEEAPAPPPAPPPPPPDEDTRARLARGGGRLRGEEAAAGIVFALVMVEAAPAPCAVLPLVRRCPTRITFREPLILGLEGGIYSRRKKKPSVRFRCDYISSYARSSSGMGPKELTASTAYRSRA